ncbi:MAG: glycosyl transferase [Polyangiaceae bacterium]|jgi:cellulose synthase/poly-beta-1,6-N-acetylglucosamine synthase-like glycosyltransferase|nr:glycosyl transferase [Polyangiaceae bacterium]
MAELLGSYGKHALIVLGLASAALFASALIYTVDALRRQRRFGALAITLFATALALTPPGLWLLGVLASVVVVVQGTCYFFFSARTLLRRRARPLALPTEALPSVTVLVAARDEAAVISDTLWSLDALDYPRERLEIVVIDDGSSDETYALAAAVRQRAHHRISIRGHASSGGKARRLNEATADATGDFLLFLDADHQVEPDLVRAMVAPLVAEPGLACVQVASSARNADENMLTKLLEMEYLFRCYALYSGKRVAMFVGSGGMVRREALERVGGFHTEMLTEDVEMSYRLYRGGYRVAYDDALCTHDLAASNFKSFFHQRLRWMRGLWQAMALHRRETEPEVPLAEVRAHYVQFCLDGFGGLCLCVLMMSFALGALGWGTFPATAVITYMLVSCGLSFSLGCVRGGQPGKLLYLPLVPVYILAHTIPMSWALLDSFLLDKPLTWVKTERAVAPSAEVPVAGGRA